MAYSKRIENCLARTYSGCGAIRVGYKKNAGVLTTPSRTFNHYTPYLPFRHIISVVLGSFILLKSIDISVDYSYLLYKVLTLQARLFKKGIAISNVTGIFTLQTMFF